MAKDDKGTKDMRQPDKRKSPPGKAPGKGPFGQELDKMTKPMPPKKKSRKRPPAGPPKGM